MYILFYVLIPIIVSTILPLGLSKIRLNIIKRERSLSETKFTMKASKGFGIMLLIMDLFVVISIFLFSAEGIGNNGIYIVFALIILWLTFGVVQSFRQYIKVSEKEIIYNPVFGVEKVIKVTDIQTLKLKRLSHGYINYYVYSDKKLFKFTNHATGANLLVKFLRQKGVETVD